MDTFNRRITKMELQEIFNKAHKHFAGMIGPSMGNEESDDTQCAYRGTNGNKCVVGAFIPDELYNDSLEGDALDPYTLGVTKRETYHSTRVTEVLAKAFGQDFLSIDQYVLLANLQSTHDKNAMDWRNYESEDISWYDFIKPAILSCAHDFKLETGDNHA